MISLQFVMMSFFCLAALLLLGCLAGVTWEASKTLENSTMEIRGLSHICEDKYIRSAISYCGVKMLSRKYKGWRTGTFWNQKRKIFGNF